MINLFMHVCTVGILALLIWWALTSLQAIHDKLDQIPGLPDGVAVLIDEIRAARAELADAIEHTRWQVSSTGDELRGQSTIQKDRLNWLLDQYDKLLAVVNELDVKSRGG